MDETKPVRLHIDKRADAILAASVADDDDTLLTTVQTAGWLGVSEMFLIQGRGKGHGPPFIKISPNTVRYRKGDVRQWLAERTQRSNAEAKKRAEAS
jgi:predicted DNA-binding transcriptional regulator AlpA